MRVGESTYISTMKNKGDKPSVMAGGSVFLVSVRVSIGKGLHACDLSNKGINLQA